MTVKDTMVIIHPEECDLCGTCVGVCPFDAIELTEARLIIHHSLCTRCRFCVEICPFEALSMKPVSSPGEKNG